MTPIFPYQEFSGTTGVRQHDLRRTFIACHVAAGTHSKLVQERAGQSTITLTMNVYGKIAGKMSLAPEQKVKLDGIAQKALPAALLENGASAPAERKALGAGDAREEDSDSA